VTVITELKRYCTTKCQCRFVVHLQAIFFWTSLWPRAFRQACKAKVTCHWVVFLTHQLTASSKMWSPSACWSVSRQQTMQKNYSDNLMKTKN